MNKEGNYVLLDLERKQCAILPKIFTMKSSDSENKYSFFSEGKLIEGILNCSGTFEDCKAKVKDLGQDYKILYSMRSTIKNLVKKDTNNNQVASVTSTTSDSICKVDEIRNEVESEVVQEEITDQSNKHFKEIPITALLKTINKLFVDRYNLQNTKFSTSSPVSKEATNNSVKESYPKLHIPRSISAGGKRLDEEKKRGRYFNYFFSCYIFMSSSLNFFKKTNQFPRECVRLKLKFKDWMRPKQQKVTFILFYFSI